MTRRRRDLFLFQGQARRLLLCIAGWTVTLVVPSGVNMIKKEKTGGSHESYSKMSEKTLPSTPPKGWVVESVGVRRLENGSFVATCHYKPAQPSRTGVGAWDTKEYGFDSVDDVTAFIVKEFSHGKAA